MFLLQLILTEAERGSNVLTSLHPLALQPVAFILPSSHNSAAVRRHVCILFYSQTSPPALLNLEAH